MIACWIGTAGPSASPINSRDTSRVANDPATAPKAEQAANMTNTPTRKGLRRPNLSDSALIAGLEMDQPISMAKLNTPIWALSRWEIPHNEGHDKEEG